uniref:Nitroreductase domain-containing protein n=1 Tax=Panagrolaimus sp. ES5 TaxID=591445 RepID=A0AC34GY88_9BILA
MGYIKHFIASIEVWHLNVFSTVVVLVFVYLQFRSMFIARPRPKQLQHESFNNQKEAKQKEFADKQVGDSIDVIDDHDDEFHAVKEIPYRGPSYPEDVMWKRSQLFYESMKLRRSIRCFSNKTIPIKIIQNIIKTAGTSPSGANLQPWTFCVVSNESLKTRIREIVEAEEQINYSRRQTYQMLEDGKRQPTYYNEISSCIATGILLTAIHNVGLTTVVLLLPVGYPADNTHVPDIKRKPIEEIIRLY